MTPFGIRRRPRFDEDPSYAPADLLQPLGIGPRDQRDSPAATPAVSLLDSPGQEPTSSMASGRPEAPSHQAASSSIGSKAVQELATGANGKAVGAASQPTAQEEYNRLSGQRAQDKNGRLKSAVWNAFLQMSEQANHALASGRPIDEYALAGVAGRGIGGAARGAFDPSVDEEYKRRMRMGDLEQQIGQQLKIEQEQAQTANIEADTQYKLGKPNMDALELDEKRRAREQKEFNDRLGIQARDKAKNFTGFLHDEATGISTYHKGGDKTDFTAPTSSLIDPSQRYAAETAANKEGRTIDRSNDEAKQQNAQIQSNIAEATKERDRIGATLKTTPSTVTRSRRNDEGNDETYEVPNPIYDDYMQRYRQLDDQVRRDRAGLKPITKSNRASETKAFSISAFLSDPRNKGATPAQARAYAAKNYKGFDIVD